MASPCCLECYLEVGIASYDRPCPRALAAVVKSTEVTIEARLLARAELAEARWSEQTQRIAPDMKKLMQKTVELTGQVGSLEARNRELAAQLNVLWDKYEEREHEVRRLQKLLDGTSNVAPPASIAMSEAVANTVAAFKHPWELEMDRLLAVQKGWDDAKKHRHAALYKGADKKAIAELLPELQQLEALRRVVVSGQGEAYVPRDVLPHLGWARSHPSKLTFFGPKPSEHPYLVIPDLIGNRMVAAEKVLAAIHVVGNKLVEDSRKAVQ